MFVHLHSKRFAQRKNDHRYGALSESMYMHKAVRLAALKPGLSHRTNLRFVLFAVTIPVA